MIRGYLEWDREFGEPRPRLAGMRLEHHPESVRWLRQADASLLRMEDGSTVSQSLLVGPDAPAGRSPYRVSFNAVLGAVADYDALQEAEGRGEPVLFFPGWWHVDTWFVPLGGTTWRTSRRLAEAAVAPELLLDGQPLAVSVPSTNNGPGGHSAEIDTGPISGEWLSLRYAAEYWIRIVRLEHEIPSPNRLDVRVEAEEHLPARFTVF